METATLAAVVQSKLPPSVDLQRLDPVWLLITLEVTAVENVEQDVAVCSSKEMTIYNAVCVMDKLTNRQFRLRERVVDGYFSLCGMTSDVDDN